MSWHCKKCNSDDVQIRDWVNPNTGSSDENYDINTTETWCKECQECDEGIVWKDEE